VLGAPRAPYVSPRYLLPLWPHVLLAVALAACDAAPGFADEVARPTFSTVTVGPLAYQHDSDAPTATVPISVEGTLVAEGAVQARVLVRYAETDSLVVEEERELSPGAFSFVVPAVLLRGATGDYSVRVTTEGADGRAGDQAAAILRFSATNLGGPSVRVATAAPVTRPTGTARVNVPIKATVTDPDGLANIAVVYAQVPEAEGGGFLGRLYDDGDNADTTEDDGVYSAAIVVTSDFEPGTYNLEVVAVDRAGAVSAPAPFSFTVR